MTHAIICGSRGFNNYNTLETMLLNILSNYKDIEIVSGHARGADTLGETFAKRHNFKLKVFPAQWDKYGKSAGYRRNEQMLTYAKTGTPVVIAFWDGESRGTAHMIETSKRAGADVYVVHYNSPDKRIERK